MKLCAIIYDTRNCVEQYQKVSVISPKTFKYIFVVRSSKTLIAYHLPYFRKHAFSS